VRLTKYTHACVRLEQDGNVLVIDPGAWSEAEALTGAQAILLTHEHIDHMHTERVREAAAAGVPVYCHPDLAEALPGTPITAVRSGERFVAAGFSVVAVGGAHAYIHGTTPSIANLGFIVDDNVYHPGDAFHVPDIPVPTLLLPIGGSWLKLGEAIDFLTAVNPTRTFPIHDGLFNERGLIGVDRWLGQQSAGYSRLAVGESVEV
jgi:L-ascorbate metabolism protein UlaG (beta-lactamase superfamily)